jgi:nucleotide-binding universal stress UspA family protein
MKTPLSKLKRILWPIEGEEDTAAALKFLAKKPFREPVTIDVMTVWPQPQLPWPATLGQSKLLEERAIEHAQEMLDTIITELATIEYQGTVHVGIGNPSYAILEQQRRTTPDLILMGSHGRRGLSRFLMGSVSHAVLHRASCPVLIVR